MRFLILPVLLISLGSYAQCKSYILGAKGDTLNCTDIKNTRQGRWVIKAEGVRGEPGYEEEGMYKNGKKEGIWRKYTLIGDLLAIERYRWGNKDGISQYYNLAGLLREESWKAVNPENPYDTIEVPDPVDPYKVEMKVVKMEGSSVKHGVWKYYESGTGSIVKTERWFLDKPEDPTAKLMAGNDASPDSTAVKKRAPVTKTKEMIEFEKKLGKKGKKVIDGSTH